MGHLGHLLCNKSFISSKQSVNNRLKKNGVDYDSHKAVITFICSREKKESAVLRKRSKYIVKNFPSKKFFGLHFKSPLYRHPLYWHSTVYEPTRHPFRQPKDCIFNGFVDTLFC